MVEEICEKKFWAYLINGVFDNLAYEVIAVFEISKGWFRVTNRVKRQRCPM